MSISNGRPCPSTEWSVSSMIGWFTLPTDATESWVNFPVDCIQTVNQPITARAFHGTPWTGRCQCWCDFHGSLCANRLFPRLIASVDLRGQQRTPEITHQKMLDYTTVALNSGCVMGKLTSVPGRSSRQQRVSVAHCCKISVLITRLVRCMVKICLHGLCLGWPYPARLLTPLHSPSSQCQQK
jgi:hypothetical protein